MLTAWSQLQHSPGVTLGLFWELSSWAEEEEEASHRRLYQQAWGPEGEVNPFRIRHNKLQAFHSEVHPAPESGNTEVPQILHSSTYSICTCMCIPSPVTLKPHLSVYYDDYYCIT